MTKLKIKSLHFPGGSFLRSKVILTAVKSRLIKNRNGAVSMDIVLGIAISIIVAAFVFIPGVKSFSETVMDRLNTWWTSIASTIFPAS